MAYDIGQLTRDIQTEFRLFVPRTRTGIPVIADGQRNRATPENLVFFTEGLQRMTDDVQAWRDEFSSFVPDASVDDFDADMTAWRRRLDDYSLAASSAPPGDREAVLWDVTAPLLLGFYGGPTSRTPQRRLDAVTPFILANMLQVSDAWRAERWDLLVDDLEQGARDVVETATSSLPLVAGLAVGGIILWKVFS